jgi:hypothetical protein
MSGRHDATHLPDLKAEGTYLFRHRPAVTPVALEQSIEQDPTDLGADFRRD